MPADLPANIPFAPSTPSFPSTPSGDRAASAEAGLAFHPPDSEIDVAATQLSGEPPSASVSVESGEGASEAGGPIAGTVIKLDRGFPLVKLDVGSEIRCEHATALVKGARVRAVIGDRVEVDVVAGHDKGIICGIAPRRTRFVRRDPAERTASQVLAANFDLVIIAEPIVQLNRKRLERELVLAHETGARVAVVLTKSDLLHQHFEEHARSEGEGGDGDGRGRGRGRGSGLGEHPGSRPPTASCAGAASSELEPPSLSDNALDPVKAQVKAVSELAGAAVDVLATSLSDPASLQHVRDLVAPGEIAILIGKSGVGKSSLVNALAGAAVQDTAEVRRRDGKGRHTTVDRVMIPLPDRGLALVSAPTSGPAPGPAAGPAAGPASGFASGLAPGPAADPASGPAAGHASDLASDPAAGPASDSMSGSTAGQISNLVSASATALAGDLASAAAPDLAPGLTPGPAPTSYIVDMPGVRGLGLWDADQGLSAAFADIEALAAACRFRDCTHHDEPDCAVQAAVSAGQIAAARLDSYHGLAAELAATRARREDARHRRGEKASDRRADQPSTRRNTAPRRKKHRP